MGRLDDNMDLPATSTNHVRRFFSVADANRALVLVRRVVEDILEEYSLLTDLHEMLEEAQGAGRYDDGQSARERLVGAVERIQGYVEELDAIGVDLKDWTLGVVHFPSLAGGREVVLCWEAGEKEVGFWHDIDSELSDRKPIESLPGVEIPAPVGARS